MSNFLYNYVPYNIGEFLFVFIWNSGLIMHPAILFAKFGNPVPLAITLSG